VAWAQSFPSCADAAMQSEKTAISIEQMWQDFFIAASLPWRLMVVLSPVFENLNSLWT
jgi:hypothetical protein